MKVILPADVRVLKKRVGPFFTLIDALVARAPALSSDQRAGWQFFSREWRAYVDGGESWANPHGDYETGGELEKKLREWRSVLAPQCPGVPPPAPKRDVPLLPSFVTPTDVRTVKNRVEPLVRNLGTSAATCADDAIRCAWGEFARGWAEFYNEDESWTHYTAQYDCAVAYEDNLSEWRDMIELVCGVRPAPQAPPGSASSDPARGPARADGPALGPPPDAYPPIGSGYWSPSPQASDPTGPLVVGGFALLLVGGLLFAKRTKP